MARILTFTCFLLLTAFASAEVKQPNVVTLFVDDLGYRDIGCYGGPVKTPVLDRLAAEGVRFTDFHSGAPTCSPSRATFLTGRHHYRAGVYSVITERLHKMHLLESETTIAEVLKENGYATAHFGKWHLGMPTNKRKNPTPADHGFDYWFGLVNGPGPSHKNPTNFLRDGKRVGPMNGYSCQIVVDEALTWLDEKRDANEPFFLNLWFNEPHAVIAAPDEIVSQYGALDDQAAIYSGTIDNTDRAIGRLVAKLEKLGELDNTIILYASDNGSYRQERNGELRGKKGSQFEGGHRVPGIFYWKGGIPGGRVEDEPAGVVDLLPTLCGLIGIEKPVKVHLDGSDLTPMLTGAGKFERHQPLFWMSGANMVLRMGDHTLFASGTAKSHIDFKTADRLMKQIKEVLGDDLEKELGGMDFRSRLFNGSFANPEANRLQRQHRDLYYFNEAWIPELKKSGIGRVQLYDLSKDLGQQNDIAKEHPELVARMKKQAAAIYRSVMADAPEWLTPEEQAAAKQPQGNGPQPAAVGTSSSNTPDLLARIDKNPLPDGYQGSSHQPYVDRVMAGLKPKQRARVGQLWKEKRRLDPDLPNPGASFIRILTHVAGAPGGGAKGRPARTTSPPSQEGLIGKATPLADPLPSIDAPFAAQNWHQWRGPEANGVARAANPPVEWSEAKNVRWKVAIDGKGNASPIIWGDKVFLLTAINTGRVDPSLRKPEDQPKRVFGIKHPNTFYKFEVLCLDRNTGKELWRQTASEHVPHEGTHHDADYASASPTTDGERLYCWFGSAGMYCYDLDGKKLWDRDLGKAYVGASLGEGCSPVVHQDKLVIVRDHARQSSIEVLDARTGKTVWKKDRNEPNAWATPAIGEHSGKTQVITAASNMVRSYDLDNGDIIWQCSGLTGNVTPCPIVDGDMVYCMSGYEGYALLALRLDSQGDISNSEKIKWKKNQGTPYVPSAVLSDGLLYFTQSNQGIVTAVDVKTGETVLEKTRLPGISNLYSSPVGTADRIYFTSRDGKTVVLKRSDKLEVLATNKLDDQFNASPAIVGNQLFLRGRKSLYCLESEANKEDLDNKDKDNDKKTTKRSNSSSKKRPNVVVLLADDLGSKDIGCDGGPVKTPALDRLAASGVRFTDFHSGAPVCSTSRATLLTGRHHLRTGVYTVIQDHIHNMHLLKREVTIAEHLKANGYDTAHLGKWHLGTPFRGMEKPWIDEHGFDYWFATDLNAAPSHRNPRNFWRNRERVGEMEGYACQLVVDEAITWLDQKRDAAKPFFLNVWFHEPHAPLAAPDEIVKKYGEPGDPAAVYSATIDNTDRAIARLVKKLEQTDSLDNTIIIYTSDHGSYRHERNGNLQAGKGSLMEGGTRTPGIIHWPKGIKGGRVESTPAGAVDLLPTVCGLVGIKKPDGVHLDGTDLSPILTGDRSNFKRQQPLTWHSPTSQPVVAIREGKYSLVGRRDKEYPKDQKSIEAIMDDMKVILEKKHGRQLSQSELWHKAWNSELKTPEWNRLRSRFVMLNTFQEAWIPLIKAGSGGITRFQLYDLSTDPRQQKNIAPRFPDVTNRLKEQVLAINASVLQEAPEWANSVVHRLATTNRSAFDAFAYVNRIPEKQYDEEAAEDFAGRIFGRLANQEGRVLIKAPPSMSRMAYEGFKTFLRYEGDASVGNCAACHTPPNFTDGLTHVVSKGGDTKNTLSLRNLSKRQIDVRKVLMQKLESAKQKKTGQADEISDSYNAMNLSERGIPGLLAFLKLLEDVPDDQFRDLILKAKVLDTSKELESK